MGMKVASKKAKGRNLQKLVVQKILAKFPQLTERDVASTSMGASGIDVQLSEAAAKLFPFATECKAQEALSLYPAFEQAKANAKDLTPLLIVKKNRQEVLAVLRLDDFMKLV